jgi:hypothetical protein
MAEEQAELCRVIELLKFLSRTALTAILNFSTSQIKLYGIMAEEKRRANREKQSQQTSSSQIYLPRKEKEGGKSLWDCHGYLWK